MAIDRLRTGRPAGREQEDPAAERRTGRASFLLCEEAVRPGKKVEQLVADADRASARSGQRGAAKGGARHRWKRDLASIGVSDEPTVLSRVVT